VTATQVSPSSSDRKAKSSPETTISPSSGDVTIISISSGRTSSPVLTQVDPALWERQSPAPSTAASNSPLANPAIAAIASSLGIILDEKLTENAARVGSRLKTGLSVLAERPPSLASVRGEGLFLGFDLVKPGSAEPWTSAECRKLFDATLRRGLVTMAYAPRVRINPPLILTEAEADESLSVLDEALSEVEGHRHAVAKSA